MMNKVDVTEKPIFPVLTQLYFSQETLDTETKKCAKAAFQKYGIELGKQLKKTFTLLKRISFVDGTCVLHPRDTFYCRQKPGTVVIEPLEAVLNDPQHPLLQPDTKWELAALFNDPTGKCLEALHNLKFLLGLSSLEKFDLPYLKFEL